jgi:hypothetical protein
MRSYKLLKIGIAALAISYFLIGNISQRYGIAEIFPIATWELFSYVPRSEDADFGVKILAVNGTSLDSPVYFEKASQFFTKIHSIDAYMTIQVLGKALLANDQSTAASYRDLLENVYLADQAQITYVVTQRRYDLLERWNHGTFLSEVELGVFNADQGQ